MHIFKLVTINILTDLSLWEKRKKLLARGLTALNPDLIALQEIHLPHNPAQWLADQLGYEHVFLTPKTGFESNREAIAILSRLPIDNYAALDLKGQNRVAQFVQVSVVDQPLIVANGHFYWQPGESAVRLQQVERLLEWLKSIPGNPPCIVCGDFNSTPETAAIQRMRQDFSSAYAAIHGAEPEYTCPTPLPRSAWSQLRTFLGFFLLVRPNHLDPNWRGTLDYIFFDPRLKVMDCQVILDQPSPDNSQIYPSDHFGLFATIKCEIDPKDYQNP
jgi:endonuclease/exonuclease/phosphatase family metal-dependent hydrolase